MFDRYVVVDWSARSAPSPRRPAADAIWLGYNDAPPDYIRTRYEAEVLLERQINEALKTGERLLIGFDFPFGYPRGFAGHLTGKTDALAVWDWLDQHIDDGANNDNNRFAVASEINRKFDGLGPFWGCPPKSETPDLPMQGRLRHGHGMPERREVEQVIPSAQPCWKLFTTGSVGSQSLLGLPMLSRLRTKFARDISVWPFEPITTRIVLAEIYPSVLSDHVDAICAETGEIKDSVQVRLLAGAFATLDREGGLETGFDAVPDNPAVMQEEGWILGVGIEGALRDAAEAIRTSASPDPAA